VFHIPVSMGSLQNSYAVISRDHNLNLGEFDLISEQFHISPHAVRGKKMDLEFLSVQVLLLYAPTAGWTAASKRNSSLSRCR